MLRSTLLMSFVIAVILFSCAQSQNEKQSMSDDVELADVISSSAAVQNKKDTVRQFVRTADLKFKVRDVASATYGIENIVNRHGGFVSYTSLSSQINAKSVVPVSADSSVETTRFTITNTITLRVPNHYLDTTLKELGRQVEYLDYRVIKADDVALQILGNAFTEKQSEKYQERMGNAIDKNRKKLTETIDAEGLLQQDQLAADAAQIAGLNLNDQVKFSTVSVFIYQNEGVIRERVAIEKIIVPYQPGFTSALKDAFYSGWNLIENIVLIVARLWALILLAIVLYLLYKRYSTRVDWLHSKN